MQLNLKPSHARVRDYYDALNQYGQLNISHETAVREAFASLLDSCAHQFQWKLIHEFRISLPKKKSVIVDGAVLDAFSKAGKRLAELHIDYEKQKEYPLERTEKPGEKLNLRVERMRLNKDKTAIIYNDFLTLTGIPKKSTVISWAIAQPLNG